MDDLFLFMRHMDIHDLFHLHVVVAVLVSVRVAPRKLAPPQVQLSPCSQGQAPGQTHSTVSLPCPEGSCCVRKNVMLSPEPVGQSCQACPLSRLISRQFDLPSPRHASTARSVPHPPMLLKTSLQK